MSAPGRGEMEPWLYTAYGEVGVHETSGPQATKKIQEYHAVTTLKATSDEVAWCSSFVCWCMEQNQITSTKSAAARSWLTWGYKLKEPREGCIVVLMRGNDPTKGHVGFWIGETKDSVCVLGGNQSNQVCEQMYLKSKVKEYRWPFPIKELPK